MSSLVAEQTAENAKAVNQGTSGIQSFSSPSNPDPDAQQTILSVFKSVLSMQNMGCHSVAEQLMAAGATDEEVKKTSQIMAQTVRKLEGGSTIPEPGIEVPKPACDVVVWTQSSLRAYLDSAAWISKAKDPSRGVCRMQPQKRKVWQRSASKKKMSYNLLCQWFWIRLIAVPFYLSLSRVGEAENPGPVCATAKLFGARYDATGQWSSEFVQQERSGIGTTIQLFSERFGKDSKPYTSLVSQDIHSSTHSHPDRSSMLALPVHVGDPAYTQQFCDYLSLFQEGEQSGSGQHVLSNLHFRGMEGKERSNPFCHRTIRGGRKHTGKRRKLELSKGVVNILQCNVTTWSEHARHYIFTSDFDATLISETHLRK